MIHGMSYFELIESEGICGLLGGWREEFPTMGVLALVAEADREAAVPLLQEVCNRMNIPLLGAVFPALLDRGAFHGQGCIILRFDVMPFAALYDLSPSADQGVEMMAGELGEKLDNSHGDTLFMIFDAMVSTIATILDDLYLRLADRVHYMGVSAGSETFKPMPCLFDAREVKQNAVLAILLRNQPGAVVEHCYLAPERMISATSTDGNRIYTIDWRPAFEVYREAAEMEYGVKIDRENFYRLGVHFPFGIIRANNEILVRIPVALEDDGSVFCVGEVPPNALLTLLRAPEVDSVQTVDKLTVGLRNLHGHLEGLELLLFYCAGRRIHLGDRADHELQEMGRRTAAGRISGALSLGEVGQFMQWGYPFFHNGALVCSRWGTR
jgi:hypothetical protein